MITLSIFAVSLLLLSIAATGWSAETNDQEGKEKEAFYLKTGQDLVDLCSLDKDHPLYDDCVGDLPGKRGG